MSQNITLLRRPTEHRYEDIALSELNEVFISQPALQGRYIVKQWSKAVAPFYNGVPNIDL